MVHLAQNENGTIGFDPQPFVWKTVLQATSWDLFNPKSEFWLAVRDEHICGCGDFASRKGEGRFPSTSQFFPFPSYKRFKCWRPWEDSLERAPTKVEFSHIWMRIYGCVLSKVLIGEVTRVFCLKSQRLPAALIFDWPKAPPKVVVLWSI